MLITRVTALVFAALIATMTNTMAQAIEEGQLPAHIGDDGALLCKESKSILRLQLLLEQAGFSEAFVRLENKLIAQGQCAVFNAGTDIIIEKVDRDTSMLCVRPHGEPFCGWTSPAAVTLDKSK
jgi:hypothetical protein